MPEILADKILKKLGELHKELPNMRIGIIIQSALDLKKKKTNVNFHEISSKEFHNSLIDFQEKCKKDKKKVVN